MDIKNENQKCENLYTPNFSLKDLNKDKMEYHKYNSYEFNDNKKKIQFDDKSETVEFESDFDNFYKKNAFKEYSKQSTISIDNNDAEHTTLYSFEPKDSRDKNIESHYKQCEKTNKSIKNFFHDNELDKLEINDDELDKFEVNENESVKSEKNVIKSGKSEINENEANTTKLSSIKYENDLVSNVETDKNVNTLENYEENSENNLDINWNKSQIKTCIRIKPPDSMETEFDNIITQKGSNQLLINYGLKNENKICEFYVDKVFNQGSPQSEVWKSINFCIDSVFYFKNATVFAHGHTGTGKTYTMIGPDIMDFIKKNKKKFKFGVKKNQPNDLLINTNSLKLVNNNSNGINNTFFHDRKRSCSQPIFNLPPRMTPLINTNSTNKKMNDANSVLNYKCNYKFNAECANDNNHTKHENYKTFSEYRSEYKFNFKGIKEEIQYVLNSENKGMIPRACEEIMKRLSALKSSANTEECDKNSFTEKYKLDQNISNGYKNDTKTKDIFNNVKVYASYMQLYNDRIFDLLNPCNESQPYLSTLKSNFTNNTTFVSGLLTVEVTCCEELIELLIYGTSNRACRITKTNEMSTRSHSIFKIELRNLNGSKSENCKSGNLLLIDLAGNEKYEASNEKLYTTEVCSINRSLSALSLCINELSKGSKSISYRNSILTRLLQGSLGGSSKTVFICTISPYVTNIRDTLSSLTLAVKAKKIQFENKKHNSYMYEDIKKLKKELNFLKKFIFFQYITNKYESKKRLKKIKDFYFNNSLFTNEKIDSKKLIENVEKYSPIDNSEIIAELNEHKEKVTTSTKEQYMNKNEESNERKLNQMINTYKVIENIYNDYEFTSFNSLLLQWNMNNSSIKKVKDKLKTPGNKKHLWFNSNGNINKKSIVDFIETHTIEYEIDSDDEAYNKNKPNEKKIINEEEEEEEDTYNNADEDYEDVAEVDNYDYCDDEYGIIEREMGENESLEESVEKNEKKNHYNSDSCYKYVKPRRKVFRKEDDIQGVEAFEKEKGDEPKQGNDGGEVGISEESEADKDDAREESEYNTEKARDKKDIKKKPREKSEAAIKATNENCAKEMVYNKEKDFNKEKKRKKKKRSENYDINEHLEDNTSSNEYMKCEDDIKTNCSLSTNALNNKDHTNSHIIINKRKYLIDKNKEKKCKKDDVNEESNSSHSFNINANKKKVFNNTLKNKKEDSSEKSIPEIKKGKFLRYLKMKKKNLNSLVNDMNNSSNHVDNDDNNNDKVYSYSLTKNIYRKKQYLEFNNIYKSKYLLENGSNENVVSQDSFTVLNSLKNTKYFKNYIDKESSSDRKGKMTPESSEKINKEKPDSHENKNNSIDACCSEHKNANKKNNFVNNVEINNLVINKFKSFKNSTKHNNKTMTHESIGNNIMYLNGKKNDYETKCEFLKNEEINDEETNLKYNDLFINVNDDRERSISENCCYNNFKNKTIIGKNNKGEFAYYIEFDKFNNIKKHILGESLIKSRQNDLDILYDSKYKEMEKNSNNDVRKSDNMKKVPKSHLKMEIKKSWLNFEKKLEDKLKKKESDTYVKNHTNISNNASQISAIEENKKKLKILKNRYDKIFVDSKKANTKDLHDSYSKVDNSKCSANTDSGGSSGNNNNNISEDINSAEINTLKLIINDMQVNNMQNKNVNLNNTIPFKENLNKPYNIPIVRDKSKNVEKEYLLNNINKESYRESTNKQNNEVGMHNLLYKDFNNANSSVVNYSKKNADDMYYDAKKINYLNGEYGKTDIHKKLNKTDTISQLHAYNNLSNQKFKNILVKTENFNLTFSNNSVTRDVNTLNMNSIDKKVGSKKISENYCATFGNKPYYENNYTISSAGGNISNLNNETCKAAMNKFNNEFNIKRNTANGNNCASIINTTNAPNNYSLVGDNKEDNSYNKLYNSFYKKNHLYNFYVDKKESEKKTENGSKNTNEGKAIMDKEREAEKEERRKINIENEKNKIPKIIEDNKYIKITDNDIKNRNYNINNISENNYVRAFNTDNFYLKKSQQFQADIVANRKMHKIDFFYLNDVNNNNLMNSENMNIQNYNYINENTILQNNKVSYINNMITYNSTNANEKVKNIHYYSNDINHKYMLRSGIISSNTDSTMQVNPLSLNSNTSNNGIVNDINGNDTRKLKLLFKNENDYKTNITNQVCSSEIKKRNTAPIDSNYDSNCNRNNFSNNTNYLLDKAKATVLNF